MPFRVTKKRASLLLLLLLLLIIAALFVYTSFTPDKSFKPAAIVEIPKPTSTQYKAPNNITDNFQATDYIPITSPSLTPTTNVLGLNISKTPAVNNRPTINRRTPVPTPSITSSPTASILPTLTPTVGTTGAAQFQNPRPSIQPLPSSRRIAFNQKLKGILAENSQIDIENTGSNGVKVVSIRFRSNNVPLAEISADFTFDRNWSGVNSGKNTEKSFIHSLVQQSGAGSSFTLYIPIPSNRTSNRVAICPGANSLDEISEACNNVVIKQLGDAGVEQITNEYGTFWKVSGLTGTGGQSLLEPFEVSDNLTRLQRDTISNHTINFGTINGLLLPTDSLTITFGDAWDLSQVSLADIDFLDDNNQLEIASSAALNIWGVEIDAVNGVLNFLPPTTGTAYIEEASLLEIRIGNNAVHSNLGETVLTNPFNIGNYQLSIEITNTHGLEDASIDIPIVDSDQVNITSFVLTQLSFDIDMGLAENTDCNFNSCLGHENGQVMPNYTIDIGEMNSIYINRSNDNAVMHLDGEMGKINSAFLRLSTNAYNGGIVYVQSANAGLIGPGSNTIPSVAADGDNIEANSGLYGFNLTIPGTGNGILNRNSNCMLATSFCRLTTAPNIVFNSNGAPIAGGIIRFDLAVASSYINNPGIYTDTLTFIAVPSY